MDFLPIIIERHEQLYLRLFPSGSHLHPLLGWRGTSAMSRMINQYRISLVNPLILSQRVPSFNNSLTRGLTVTQVDDLGGRNVDFVTEIVFNRVGVRYGAAEIDRGGTEVCVDSDYEGVERWGVFGSEEWFQGERSQRIRRQKKRREGLRTLPFGSQGKQRRWIGRSQGQNLS